MKKHILSAPVFLVIILVIFNCSNASIIENGTSKIVINTPKITSFPFKTISSNYNVNIDTSGFDDKNFRFDVIIENKGRRLQQLILKSNSISTLKVPSAIPLDVFIGVYYAENNSTNDEKYNVYLASDKRENIVLMSDDTSSINFTLDLTKKNKVTTYYNSAIFGSDIASFTGGGNYLNNYFSVYPLENNNNTRIIQTPDDFGNPVFTSSTLSTLIPNNRGVLDFDSNYWWYVDMGGIYNVFQNINNISVFNNGFINNLYSKIINIKNFYTSYGDFHFLNYINGYISFYKTATLPYSQPVATDMSGYSNYYPSYSYILDLARDNQNNYLIATKSGLYLVNWIVGVDPPQLINFASGNISAALAGCSKLIKIVNPDNSDVLITNVTFSGNNIYLGTTHGLYYIDTTASDWINFQAYAGTSLKIFNQDKIKKFKDFNIDEPIVFLKMEDGFNGGDGNPDVLIAATNKRIFFNDIQFGKKAQIGVLDGLPFVPSRKFANTIKFSNTDFRLHDAAPVRHIFVDNNYAYWICTDFGLGSVQYNDLFN